MKWDFLDSNRFGPKNEYYRKYRDNQVKSFWAGLTSSFIVDLRLGNINAVARVGSPVAPISDLERIVWAYVTEIDWAAGTVALKDGTTLFDVRMGTGSVTDAKPVRAVRLPSDQDRGFSAFVAAVHPEGLDRTVSSSKLATNYAGWVKALPEAHRKEFSSTIVMLAVGGRVASVEAEAIRYAGGLTFRRSLMPAAAVPVWAFGPDAIRFTPKGAAP